MTTRRRERGAALVELSFCGLLLATIVFATIDFGRLAQYQNRMSNAAREGASVARITPRAVSSGCNGRVNVVDRTEGQDVELSEVEGYSVTVAKESAGTVVPYSGCNTTSVSLEPGDRVVVTVTADVRMYSPFTSVFTGRTVELERKVETEVHG